jgi:hypothetical protein
MAGDKVPIPAPKPGASRERGKMRERIELSGYLFIVTPADRGTLKGLFFAL